MGGKSAEKYTSPLSLVTAWLSSDESCGVADTVEIGTTAETKEGYSTVNFSVVCIFYYMYSLVHYCVHPMHDYSSLGTRLAHSSPRQSRIFILHFLCLVATTSLTRSSSLVPSWSTPSLKNRNRCF